jgi:hypothetical protein
MMNKHYKYYIFFLTVVSICINLQAQTPTRFAVIGDFGWDGPDEMDVANLVKSWNPDFIITVGDDNYDYGAASTIDPNIGKYYHDYIYPYLGTYGNGSPDSNRFFPVPGNHDWRATDLQPYLDYFTLPNNERYYDFIWNDLHFFMIDADEHEPDGYSSTSTQATWIKNKMQNSTAKWKIVALHYSPYSSALTHGSVSTVRWPYQQWGADAVFSGHDHTYERLTVDSLTYFVDGLGGKSVRLDDFDGGLLPESQAHYSADYGAMLIEVYTDSINCKFINRNGLLIDNYTIIKAATNIKEESNFINNFYLGQNYPNPFNPITRISWHSPMSSWQTLKLYDVLGNEVATLFNEEKPAGNYEAEFDASSIAGGLSSGIYFYQLKVGHFVATKKMILMK